MAHLIEPVVSNSDSSDLQPRLRVAAIDFLNPAPLLYGFEHAPLQAPLLRRYQVSYTSPAKCAEQLRTGEADLGLVPIGALPFLPGVAAVPGCTIASLDRVRSIQLVLRPGLTLQNVRSIAADTASRSSAAYVQVLLRKFKGNAPPMVAREADLGRMLPEHDAALLIGDPALLAMERRDRFGEFQDCTWIDVAAWWRECTGLPWVAAVWAVRTAALEACGMQGDDLTQDLTDSRDQGLAHVDDIVEEWRHRIALQPQTIRAYLTRHIHYVLDRSCLLAIQKFFELAAGTGVLPEYNLPLL